LSPRSRVAPATIRTAAAATGILLAVGRTTAAPPPAQNYYFAVDVPTRLGANDYTPNQIVRGPGSAWTLETALPSGTVISALELSSFNGAWLFAPADPVTIGASTWTARDVVSVQGMFFNPVISGAANGLPPEARIDALAAEPSGALLLSFDAPVLIGSTLFGRSDLVRFSGGAWSLAWSAAVAGVPDYANLVGASRDSAGSLVVAFDVPVKLAGIDYLPGDLVRWASPGGFSLAAHDSGWPLSSELRDFAYAPSVGAVPERQSEGTPLTIAKTGTLITLSWGAACGAAWDTDYEVYEGTIGSWYSHTARYCSTNGALTSSFVPSAGNFYYLVVARNGPREGSYGRNSNGAERPQAPNACVPKEMATCS